MGGKSKPTIGYWYKLLLHFGLGRGPIDALLEFRGGDRTAWQGEAEGGTIAIAARELWGGEKAEGGIEGSLDVMLGEADQMPNARLTTHLGDQQSAYRGRATVAFEGLYGAFNPYPKAASFKVLRIFNGWDDDACWYPEKAVITFPPEQTQTANGYFRVEVGAKIFNAGTVYALADRAFTGTAREIAQYAMDVRNESFPGSEVTFAEAYANNPPAYGYSVGAYSVEHGPTDGVVGIQVVPVCPTGYTSSFVQQGEEDSPLGPTNPAVFCTLTPQLQAMNPAHILYDSITSQDMQGEPVDMINEASFIAAADRLYSEGFGLCTTYDPAAETVEAFQQRICNVIGASLSQSRVDGCHYLTLIRGDHDLESLPVLTDDDILEYQEEPSDPLESVNQVTIEWFDPIKKEKRSTTPIQSLGAIQAAGGVIAEVSGYPEIPYEPLALRVGARDLAQKATPLKRLNLTTNRIPYAWRASQFFRLQAPRRGIADMVCMVGEIDAGTPRSGSMRLVVIQDVASMPDTTYVEPEPGVDTSPSPYPSVPPVQLAMEAPYAELVISMSTADRDALAADAGFLIVAGSRPTTGINYDLWTRGDGEEYADRGDGDWAPVAVVVEAADQLETSFTLTEASDLDQVVVGMGADWGGEQCRVDAIDTGALTLTLGRGCLDTPPIAHAAGESIVFYDGFTASDLREYSDGENAFARLLSRTSSQSLPISLAPELTVEMGGRAARPYAPGVLRITDDVLSAAAYPSDVVGEVVVTWAHRDRRLQQDQRVDATAASVGPEAGTTYTVRFYLDDVLDEEETGITGTASTPVTLSGNGTVRLEVWAVRDALESYRAAVAEFAYLTEPPYVRITDAADARTIDSGDRRITD